MGLSVIFQIPQIGTGQAMHVAPGRCGVGLIVAGDFQETPPPDENTPSTVTMNGHSVTAYDMVKIEIFESTGTGPGETQGDRLLATLNGAWDRTPAPAARGRSGTWMTWRFVLESLPMDVYNVPWQVYSRNGWTPGFRDISRLAADQPPPSYRIRGFVPETIPTLGVDHFVLFMRVDPNSTAHRRFPICFPFFVDDREGPNLELKAVVKSQTIGPTGQPLGWNTVGTTPDLTIPARREQRTVRTTTSTTDTYTDDLIGVTVLHHQHFLVGASAKLANASWPAHPTAERHPLVGSFFANYASLNAEQKLRIVYSSSLFDVLTRSAAPSEISPTSIRDAGTLTTQQLIDRIHGAARTACENLVRTRFVQAGFTDCQVLRDTAATPADQQTLRNLASGTLTEATALDIPFFRFFVSGPIGAMTAVGLGEIPWIAARDTPVQVNGTAMTYRLPSTVPLGAGTKSLSEPIQVRSSYFADVALGRNRIPYRPPASVQEMDENAWAAGKAIGTVILHEVAHSLGLMHEALVESPDDASLENGVERFHEGSATPVDSVMCSAADEHPIDLQPHFSHQAKRIWQTCFGVTPDYSNGFRTRNNVRAYTALAIGSDLETQKVIEPNEALRTWEAHRRAHAEAVSMHVARGEFTEPRPADVMHYRTHVTSPPEVDWRDRWGSVSWFDRDLLISEDRSATTTINYSDRVRNPFRPWNAGYDT